MKPRTKLQFEVLELSNRLLPISKSEKEWALKNCLDHVAFATKNKVTCLDCGSIFSPDLVKRKRATCPSCGTKLIVEKTLRRTAEQRVYFATAEVFGEFQVIRNYELNAKYKSGKPFDYYLHEILQYWVLPSGKMEMVGKNHHLSWHCDVWSGSMEIRKEGSSYWNNNKYAVYPYMYHPDSYFKPEYTKYGIDKDLKGINFLEAIKYVPKDPKLETLLKIKQHYILGAAVGSHSGNVRRYWSTLKICFRNKYIVKDASMYFDYLDLLQYFRKDVRNAKFVCPKNLKKEHDRLMNKKREIQRREERERQAQAAIKRQQNLEKAIIEYVEKFKKFFALEFVDGDLSIKLLQSVQEFKEEGDELKHCVYTNEYYLKNALVFSAKINGKRTETIELSLPNLIIEQSRGLNNVATEHHDRIVKIMKKGIPKIRNIIKPRKPKKVKESVKQSA